MLNIIIQNIGGTEKLQISMMVEFTSVKIKLDLIPRTQEGSPIFVAKN